MAYVFSFLGGTTWSSKVTIGLSYTMEFMIASFQPTVVFLFAMGEPIAVILITAWYQFVDHSWLKL